MRFSDLTCTGLEAGNVVAVDDADRRPRSCPCSFEMSCWTSFDTVAVVDEDDDLADGCKYADQFDPYQPMPHHADPDNPYVVASMAGIELEC